MDFWVAWVGSDEKAPEVGDEKGLKVTAREEDDPLAVVLGDVTGSGHVGGYLFIICGIAKTVAFSIVGSVSVLVFISAGNGAYVCLMFLVLILNFGAVRWGLKLAPYIGYSMEHYPRRALSNIL